MKTGAATALAASLALLAVPASAQDGNGWRGRGGGDAAQTPRGGGNGGGWGGGWRGQGRGDGGGRGGPRGEQAGATAAPSAPRAQAEQQNGQRAWWRGESGAGREGPGRDGAGGQAGWRGRGGQAQAPVAQAPAATPQAAPRQNWRENGGRDGQGRQTWQDRDRSAGYAGNRQWQGDRGDSGVRQGRNPTYVDPNRNRTYRDRDRAVGRGDDGWRGNTPAWRGDRQAYRGSGRDWNRDWRRDNRYDWRGYRDQNRGIYRLGAYYAPYRNYSYRRLSTGFYLDTLFFGSRYWINDPWSYRLPPADGPFRWVRYYDDALLVDTYSGEVADVIYDFFW